MTPPHSDLHAKRPAGLSNWRTPPHSAWAFGHVAEIVPTIEIANDPARVEPLPIAATPLAGLSLHGPDASTLSLEQVLQASATDAFLVLHEGRVVHESYANGMTAHTPHILMSATKSVVGLVAGVLQARGDIDVDAEVTAMWPALARTAYAGATIRHLLDMRTGIAFDEKTQAAYANATHWDALGAGESRSDLETFFAGLAAHATGAPIHGGPFSYVSANTDLLGLLIERAAGRAFAQLASDLLWKPMGAEDAAAITTDAKGAPRCTGGLCATVRDLARVGQMVLARGRSGSVDVVPASWIDDLWQGGDAQAWNRGSFAAAFGGMRMRYRSGWYLIEHEPKMLFAMGIHGQHLFVDPANRLVVAKFSSQATPTDPMAFQLTLRGSRRSGAPSLESPGLARSYSEGRSERWSMVRPLRSGMKSYWPLSEGRALRISGAAMRSVADPTCVASSG